MAIHPPPLSSQMHNIFPRTAQVIWKSFVYGLTFYFQIRNVLLYYRWPNLKNLSKLISDLCPMYRQTPCYFLSSPDLQKLIATNIASLDKLFQFHFRFYHSWFHSYHKVSCHTKIPICVLLVFWSQNSLIDCSVESRWTVQHYTSDNTKRWLINLCIKFALDYGNKISLQQKHKME